jgi:hypothetical protein
LSQARRELRQPDLERKRLLESSPTLDQR